MSLYGPFQTRVGLYQRFTNFIDLIVRNTPDVGAYKLWGSDTLNNAYGNPVGSGVGGVGSNDTGLIATLNGIARTLGASRAGCSKVPENRKGQTSFQVDPRDWAMPDEDLLYFRVQEQRQSTGGWMVVTGPVNNGDPILGPILVAPSVAFAQQASAMFGLLGTAPSATLCVEGRTPIFDVTAQVPNPMHIVFPLPISTIMIRNYDPVEDLLFSYGKGQPMIRVPAGEAWVPGAGHGANAVTEMLFADGGGSVGAGLGCSFGLDLLSERGLV